MVNENFGIQPQEEVTFLKTGRQVEVSFSQFKSSGGHIQKVDKDHYINLVSGEFCECQHTESRADSADTVRRSMKKARDIINTNCIFPSKLRWITLTYAENMQDKDRLYSDFQKFVQRLQRKIGKFEYIAAAEPQGRGAWHMHVLLIFSDEAPFLENKLIADTWQQGFVNVKAVTDVSNVGAYLSAYMADVELDPQNPVPGEIVEREVDGQKKKFIKGARLKWYPPGMNIFRYSRGIERPQAEKMAYRAAQSKLEGFKRTYSTVNCISDEQKKFMSMCIKEFYFK